MSETKSKAPIGLYVSVFVAHLALGLLLAQLYLSSRNTLYNNGNWTSAKTTFKSGIIGAWNFFFNLQPLAGGRLDLAAWHGYQEVILNRDVDPSVVEFDLLLQQGGSYVNFSFNRTRERSMGIRFGRNRRLPPVFYKATSEGEFLRKEQFPSVRQRLKVGRWHTARVEFEDDGFTVFLDKRKLKSFKARTVRPQQIGFRGGLHTVLIDNIRVVSRDGSEFTETFSRPANWRQVNVLAVAGVLVLATVLFVALRRFVPTSDKHLLFYFLMATLVLIVASAAFFQVVRYRRGFYPNATEKLKRAEAHWKEASADETFERITARYPLEPEPGTHRILFLGSSQTAGAGARTDADNFVQQTERLLNERSSGTRYECINAAKRGYVLSEMEAVFLERYIRWQPKTLIINASNNDRGRKEQFGVTLGRFIGHARQAGIEVVLVQEPNSGERANLGGLRRLHEIMAEVGAELDVPVIDMQRILAEHTDDGFLWWDWVHLSSFGYRLFAEHLVEELERLGVVDLGESAATADDGSEN